MKNLLKKLWILNSKKLFKTSENNWFDLIPYRYKKWIQEIKPDFFYVQENKPIIFFFEGYINTEKIKSIWNSWGVPIIYVLNNRELDIYNGFSFDIKNDSFEKLEKLNIEKINENSIIEIISWKKILNLKKNTNQVDIQLLDNLKKTKDILVNEWLEEIYAQNLIWRLLFSRFLIDNEVVIDKKFFQTNREFLPLITNKTKLYRYFEYLKDRFHWDLFPVDWDEEKTVNDTHLNILYELFVWSNIWNSYIQISLFDKYDFKIIPIELISEVYEQFMSEEKQAEDWAYYTPSFIVDYILQKTLKLYLENNKECKVFDPSCGSWIFLVESFRMIIEKNLDIKGYIEIKKLKDLLKNNIFWVDKNDIAVNLSIFSLYLTLLDYVHPKDITKFTFPNIKNKNLFTNDFFDLKADFNKNIKNINFIVWNPPWGSNIDKTHLNYIKISKESLWYKTNELLVSDKQIAQSFILRINDFISKDTKVALVLPSKILYNYKANTFRQHFLKNYQLNEILELSPVRKSIFSWAIAPTFIACYEKYKEENWFKNIVIHTSIKPNIFLKYLKILIIEKNDRKEIEQSYFLKYDYLWKIMLYWNVFDFFLINRLKENYDSINWIIEKYKLLFWQWIQIWWWDKNDSSHLVWKTFLDTKKKVLSKFYINENFTYIFNKIILHRPREKALFEKWPKVLLKKWFDLKTFSNISVFTEKEYVFSDTITAITWNNSNILKNISWIFNSEFFSYFFLLQWSSAWIEREQWHNEWDRFETPIVESIKVANLVDKLQIVYNKLGDNTLQNPKLIEEKIKFEFQLNETILDSFWLSNLEKTLIDYSREITIPLINNNNNVYNNSTNKQLEDYAKIFILKFWETWNWPKKFFEIDIYTNNYIVWMNFKIVNTDNKKKINIINDKDKLKDVFTLLKLWEEKITNDFYLIRDIRGFNQDSFYIVKFNQYKNWHKAIAYQDVSEFKETIMIAENNLT